ncbi:MULTISPECIES: glycosyltransferase [unclassified Francisella]|uniref:glycosyltransferase n=1 Tax=unclassified Francisella TaxID=2610885 RepID=UPI002E341BC7|nr:MULTISPECIES: glycosyltransferase [unclassified Francisella]MED7820030.1 glycosyltransferase [Francisella sp. 19S2-4]MED7830850.1 glycosyltransferase [Francisella sp. 19S2-10]
MQNIKVLHVTKTYYPEIVGGVQEAIRLASYSEQSDFQADVFCLCKGIKKPRNVRFNKSIVYQFPISFDYHSTPVSLKALCKFRSIAKNYNIIHYHYPWPLIGLLNMLLIGLNKKVVMSYHADAIGSKLLEKLNSFICLNVFSKASKIIVASPNITLNNPYFKFKKYINKIAIIPYKLHDIIERYKPNQISKEQPQDFVLYIGQFRGYKGVNVIIDAARLLPNVKFFLVGKGKQYELIKTEIMNDKVDNVYLLGAISDEQKNKLLEKSKVLILPSITRGEAFGISLLEGMRQSKPIISTELGTGTSYVNLDGVSGLVIEPNNSKMLADAISKMYEDNELYKKLSIGARKRYKDYFCYQDNSEYIKLYEEVLN